MNITYNDGIRQMSLIYTHLLSNHMVFLSCPKSAWTMAKQRDNSERHGTHKSFPEDYFCTIIVSSLLVA